jgi:hypothetical protein
VNFVTRDEDLRDTLETSAEVAAYGTFRGSAVARMSLAPELGLYAGVDAFFDRSDNDYLVDVETADARGKLHPETLRRFHDGYEAHGLAVQAGVRGRPWADRLTLSLFRNATDKELQHNLSGTVPYGDVTLGDETLGGSLHYQLRDRRQSPLGVEVLASYARRDGRVDDVSRNLWDWHGEVIAARPTPGERGRGARVRTEADRVTGRVDLTWRLDDRNRLELVASPELTEERRVTTSVALADRPRTRQEYRLVKLVSGASWQLKLFGGRLRNDLFAKQYHAVPDAETHTTPPPDVADAVDAFGGGDALRFTLVDWLMAKASYEYATRLPGPVEYFGDGNQIDPSPTLKPETSHNANAGLVVEVLETPAGRFDAEATFFYRRTRDLIFLTQVLETARYQNVSDVDTTGVEAGLSWTFRDSLTLGANATHLEAINRSEGGFFGRFEGDRIPNLPFLYGNLSASAVFRAPGVDRIRPYWYGRYVHDYYLFWESQGDARYKLEIPAQFSQDAGVSVAKGALSATFEVQNLTNERVYDNIGVQLAGRAWHFKLVVGL